MQRLIKRLLESTGERDMYPVLRDMLVSRALPVRLSAAHIVVDTNLEGQGIAPDLAIYSELGGKPIRSPDYLYAIIEAKPGGGALSQPDKVYAEKQQYVQAGTRWFFLVDQKGVGRRDLESDDETWTTQSWSELAEPEAFEAMFQPVALRELRLENQLDAFEAGRTRTAYRDVERFGRRRFVQTIREVAELLTGGVTDLVRLRIRPSVVAARGLIREMETRWGPAVYDWTPGRGHPVEFTRAGAAAGAEFITLGQSEVQQYAEEHAAFAAHLAPHLEALRLEIEALPTYAAKIGADDVSFAKGDKASKRAIATFVYETASLILSRMLMVRFSEDHDFLTRQISNGGVQAFAGYSRYFDEPYQALLKQAYKTARKLYRDLFDPHRLDWVLESEDSSLSRALQRAMLLLSRWNFRTVKGDILSGVYDHYLETEKRRELGEVFTRPEIARYILRACGWTRDKTLLDPACGTGTFLVEALREEVERLKTAGALDLTTATKLLANISGLDINPFSVSLSQIQILWHMIDLFEGQSSDDIRNIAGVLLPLINVDGGISSLDTMGRPMVAGQQAALDLGTGRQQQGRRLTHDFPLKFRRINGAQYDVVVGNPPYVRAHRRTKDALAGAYAEVAHGQYDLYIPFLYRALRSWLKPGGRMGFVVPMGVLDAGYASALRTVLSEFRIVEIVDLELLRRKTFHGVKRPVVILIVERTPAGHDDTVRVTTVADDAYDAGNDYVDMGKAKSVELRRGDLAQTTWLPKSFVENPAWIELVEMATGAAAELSTKIRPEDLAILTTLGKAPRLAQSVQTVWVKRKGGEEYTLSLEGKDPLLYRPTLLVQDGLKLGSTKAIDAVSPLKVWKGLNVFPSGVVGAPIGHWAEGQEQELRIYRYRSVLEPDKLFAARQIGQAPTLSPVPSDGVFQNTALLLQLSEPFPLNVWVVSRVIQYYCAKVLRASIIEDITAHWYKRQLCLLPMPLENTPALRADLVALGETLFAADRLVGDTYRLIQAQIELGSRSLRALIADADPRADGVDLTSAPAAVSDIAAFVIQDEAVIGSAAWSIRVPSAGLRRWITHRLQRLISGERLGLTRDDVLNLEIPNDLEAALSALEAFEASDPDEAFESALTALDLAVGAALGLTADQVAEIQSAMATDPFLRHISPMWEKRGLSRQGYKDAAGDDED